MSDASSSEYEEYRNQWRAHRSSTIEHHVTASKFIAELELLSDLLKEYGSTAFAEALDELKAFKLIGSNGAWHPRWKLWSRDPDADQYVYAAWRVSLRVAAGQTERMAIAAEVTDENLTAASFEAAWMRLREVYHDRYPDRPKRRRGRPSRREF